MIVPWRAGADRERLHGVVWLGALLILVVVAMPWAADACAVCFGGEESDWNTGFMLGTIVMLALPPAIVLGAGVAIYRSIRRHEAEIGASEADDASSPAPPAPAEG